jgi:hypothetical protein
MAHLYFRSRVRHAVIALYIKRLPSNENALDIGLFCIMKLITVAQNPTTDGASRITLNAKIINLV